MLLILKRTSTAAPHMDTEPNRRRYLQLFGAATAVGFAGCSSGGSDDGAGDDGTTDDGGNSDTGDGSGENDGQDKDGGDGDDGTGDDDSGDDGENDSDEQTDVTRLQDVFNWSTSYVMEFESSDFSGTWRFNDGDWYLTTTGDGESFETYSIRTDSGRDTYAIAQGQCFKTTVPDLQEDLFDPVEPAGDDLEYVARGRTTVDGVEAYEFDIEDGIYYISVDTGYPVRFESADSSDVVRFHSWGATDPISPPDVECIEP
jgi:hypothetical protein